MKGLCTDSLHHHFRELHFTLPAQSKLAKGRVQLCCFSVAYTWLTTGASGSCLRKTNWIAGNKWGWTPSHEPHLHPPFPISASLLLNTPGVSPWNTPTMLLDAAGHIEIVTSGTQLLSPQGLIFNLQPNRFPSHRPSLHSPTYTSLWLPSSSPSSKANWGADCLTGDMNIIASSSSWALWTSLGLTADRPGCLPLERQQWQQQKPLCNWLWALSSSLEHPEIPLLAMPFEWILAPFCRCWQQNWHSMNVLVYRKRQWKDIAESRTHVCQHQGYRSLGAEVKEDLCDVLVVRDILTCH